MPALGNTGTTGYQGLGERWEQVGQRLVSLSKAWF
jgi:hypothetical protein